jgi:hypothetical protein
VSGHRGFTAGGDCPRSPGQQPCSAQLQPATASNRGAAWARVGWWFDQRFGQRGSCDPHVNTASTLARMRELLAPPSLRPPAPSQRRPSSQAPKLLPAPASSRQCQLLVSLPVNPSTNASPPTLLDPLSLHLCLVSSSTSPRYCPIARLLVAAHYTRLSQPGCPLGIAFFLSPFSK